MGGYIDLKSLSLESLAGIVNVYPWFAAARKELGVRMSAIGGWSEAQYADAAMYIPSRRKIADMVRAGRRVNCSDKDVADIVKAYIQESRTSEIGDRADKRERKVYVAGGDYFSKDQYEKVGDRGLPRFSWKSGNNDPGSGNVDGYEADMDFCTETLAQIYAEQGYYDQAKDIYSKLILAYPEKSAYFAALIEKLNVEI